MHARRATRVRWENGRKWLWQRWLGAITAGGMARAGARRRVARGAEVGGFFKSLCELDLQLLEVCHGRANARATVSVLAEIKRKRRDDSYRAKCGTGLASKRAGAPDKRRAGGGVGRRRAASGGWFGTGIATNSARAAHPQSRGRIPGRLHRRRLAAARQAPSGPLCPRGHRRARPRASAEIHR